MELSEHELYRATFSNVEPWLEQDKRTLVAMRKLLTEKSLSINEEYNKEVCNTMHQFFNKLCSAYYSAPLPE